MPSPVFLWEKEPTAGHTDSAPTRFSVGRRALTPPYGWIWRRCNRADVGSELSAASGG